LCHGGRLQKKQPSFTFQAGDTLSNFFNTEQMKLPGGRDYVNVDVHGNQYGLLSASKCFIKSDMTCNTCHNVHENERGKLVAFSSRCQKCHTTSHAPIPQLKTSEITSNCVDCHMATEPSHTIIIKTSGHEQPKLARFRSHFIGLYADETKKYIEKYR